MRFVRCIFTAEDGAATLAAILDSGCVPSRPPDEKCIDMGPQTLGDAWREGIAKHSDVSFEWFRSGTERASDDLYVARDGGRSYASLDLSFSVEGVLWFLERIPWSLASMRNVHPEWREWGHREQGFGDGHAGHGAACAFRGSGHESLVSRRWLDYGPWRVIRRPDDLTLVQFHDLAADAKTALEQAEPGHKRMGISNHGGFIQTDYVYEHDLKGLYEPNKKRHKIIVHGREVTQTEMLDAAALRHYRKDDPDKPLDSIAYVFAVPEEAHAHLHEMWLREIEVWTFDPATGKEIRLDDTYKPPPPNPPDWVKRLETKSAE